MSGEKEATAVPNMRNVGTDATIGEDPSVLLELIQRLKVRDVMTTKLFTLPRDAAMREAQELMRTNKISGIPVEEGGRFLGLVSLDDIIRSLVAGTIDEPCGQHMTTRLVVLEDDMPLSFAIRYFDRYHYGRFPVLDRERQLVGIICQRDINRALLLELTTELQRLESAITKNGDMKQSGALYLLREYPICKYDFENAGKVATQIKQILQQRKIAPRLIRRIAVAAYELEINLCVHSDGGVLSWKVANDCAEIIARDAGPGIEDVEWACRDGSSTASEWIRSLGFGAGMGLVNVKRVSDEFEITSRKGGGTTVKVVIRLDKEET